MIGGEPGIAEVPTIEPVSPPPTELATSVSAETSQKESQPVSPEDVGAALIAEKRRLGGNMQLTIVPTAMDSSSKDVSTTILFPQESYSIQEQPRAYGVNNELGLVYYVDSSARKYDSWHMTEYRLREGTLTASQLKPVKTPEEMEAWTTSLNETRARAERWAATEAAQSEFEKSLPGKAMEAIQNPPAPANPQPQGPIQ